MGFGTVSIGELSLATIRSRQWVLERLLADAVAGNASVGYLRPIDDGQLKAFWDGIACEVERGERIVLAAFVGGELAACVQLAPCSKPNQPHRADVQKLLVHRDHRGRGLGRALMEAVEARALALGRTLLLLDTRTGSAAEALYRSAGWVVLGVVPGFALDPDGTPGDCTFFWKQLEPRRPVVS